MPFAIPRSRLTTEFIINEPSERIASWIPAQILHIIFIFNFSHQMNCYMANKTPIPTGFGSEGAPMRVSEKIMRSAWIGVLCQLLEFAQRLHWATCKFDSFCIEIMHQLKLHVYEPTMFFSPISFNFCFLSVELGKQAFGLCTFATFRYLFGTQFCSSLYRLHHEVDGKRLIGNANTKTSWHLICCKCTACRVEMPSDNLSRLSAMQTMQIHYAGGKCCCWFSS